MAGMKCPVCGQRTFFKTPMGRKCSKCGCTMTVPNCGEDGMAKGGRGMRCSNCGRLTVFNGKCTSCGAHYTGGTK